jgi:hypothetical protein
MRSLSSNLGIITICIGLVDILGWGLKVQQSKEVPSDLATLQIGSAICLILAGVALTLYSQIQPSELYCLHLSCIYRCALIYQSD